MRSSPRTSYEYDTLSRAVRVTTPGKQMGPDTYEVLKTYDGPSGALLTIVYPDGDSVGPMTYDEVGRVASVPGVLDLVTYDAAGRPLSQANANSTTTTRAYTPNEGFLTTINTTGSQGTVQALNYTYDTAGVGLVTSVTSPVDGEGCSYPDYDDLYRLKDTTEPGSQRRCGRSTNGLVWGATIGAGLGLLGTLGTGIGVAPGAVFGGLTGAVWGIAIGEWAGAADAGVCDALGAYWGGRRSRSTP